MTTAARRRERPSAAIVLGALSGFLAGMLYVTISVPLVVVAGDAEEALAMRQAELASESVARLLSNNSSMDATTPATVGAAWVYTEPLGGGPGLMLGDPSDVRLAQEACAKGPGLNIIRFARVLWATSCSEAGGHRIATGKIPENRVGTQILYWTLLLALVVGIVTALGQASLLRPLTEMSAALERVRRGERVVRLKSTGLAELDEVVDRINDAAAHVEERVDAITARITMVRAMSRLVAHEVRNPLQSLELLTTLIASEADPEERNAIASSIRDEIRALDQVVHRILREGVNIGKMRLKRTRQPIAPLLDHVVSIHRRQAELRGIRLSVGLSSQRELMMDSAMLGRSLENLTINALQMVEEPGGEVRLSAFEEDAHLCIVCDDNGPGVDPQLGESIFDSEVTGRESGHGFGLALVRAVFVAHGGDVTYSTSPLGGARFIAKLPLNPDPLEDAQAP